MSTATKATDADSRLSPKSADTTLKSMVELRAFCESCILRHLSLAGSSGVFVGELLEAVKDEVRSEYNWFDLSWPLFQDLIEGLVQESSVSSFGRILVKAA